MLTKFMHIFAQKTKYYHLRKNIFIKKDQNKCITPKKCKIYPIKKKYTKSNYITISKFEDGLEREMKIKMNSP